MTRRDAEVEDGAAGRYSEQSVAAIVGIAAIALAAIGLLRGFAIFTWGTAPEAPINTDFGSGLMWLLPALAMSVLAVALARADHRHGMQPGERGQFPHVLAYIGGIATIGIAALALLTAFDWIGLDTNALTGMLWGIASIVAAFITLGLHIAVPTTVTDEDHLVRLVESRVRTSGRAPEAPPRPATEPERRP